MEPTLTFRSVFQRPARTSGAPGVELAAGATMTLRVPRGTRIAVTAGRVWLTEPDDLDDHFIAPGEQHVVGRGGLLVLECVSTAAARLRIAAAP